MTDDELKKYGEVYIRKFLDGSKDLFVEIIEELGGENKLKPHEKASIITSIGTSTLLTIVGFIFEKLQREDVAHELLLLHVKIGQMLGLLSDTLRQASNEKQSEELH